MMSGRVRPFRRAVSRRSARSAARARAGPAAAQQNITYKRELLAGDIVEKSIRLLHEMRNGESGEIAASCEITGVHMDRQARKSVAFTDAIRRSAAKYIVNAEAVMA